MESRQIELSQWVETQLRELQLLASEDQPQPLVSVSGDASFRRYFRCGVGSGTGAESYICVDAPPDKENNPAFVAVAQAFGGAGLVVPRVLASDFARGFLLLSDLGDQLLWPLLKDADAASHWYRQALDQLLLLQRADYLQRELPPYSDAILLQEMMLFSDWFCERHLQRTLSQQEREGHTQFYQWVIEQLAEQPKVAVHRDFHSRNIMLVEDQQLGVIDFQDALWGPVTYDLLSLLRDVYLGWSASQVEAWVGAYYRDWVALTELAVSEAQFQAWFNVMGVQRHLKVAGIFARLYHRDGKSRYLDDLPQTLTYLRTELAQLPREERRVGWFCDWFEAVVPGLEAAVT